MTSTTPHAARLDRDTVLVISGEDATATAVMAELERHPVVAVLLDIGDFPARQSLAAATTASGAWSGRLRGGGAEVDLSRVRSVFYRRPTKFSIPEGVSASDAVLAEYEARLAWAGCWPRWTACGCVTRTPSRGPSTNPSS